MPTKKKKLPLWKENKIEYTNNYNKEKYKSVQIKLRKDTDTDVIEKLDNVDNKASYIVKLIREDIKRGN